MPGNSPGMRNADCDYYISGRFISMSIALRSNQLERLLLGDYSHGRSTEVFQAGGNGVAILLLKDSARR